MMASCGAGPFFNVLIAQCSPRLVSSARGGSVSTLLPLPQQQAAPAYPLQGLRQERGLSVQLGFRQALLILGFGGGTFSGFLHTLMAAKLCL